MAIVGVPGGNGGNNSAGRAGGTAINNGIGTRLRINNNGVIAGGGGGGGGGYYSPFPQMRLTFGGGGGRPFGAAGAAGGKCNIRGQGSEYNGGAAGKAVTGNAPTWTKVGTIYGSRV